MMSVKEVRPARLFSSTGVWYDGIFVVEDTYSEDPDQVRLTLQFDDCEIASVSDVGFFDALCEIRGKLERQGLILWCNGAREDVYPSGMSRNMGAGDLAFRLEMGRPSVRSDLVDILEIPSEGVCVSIDEQRKFYERWLDSIKRN